MLSNTKLKREENLERVQKILFPLYNVTIICYTDRCQITPKNGEQKWKMNVRYTMTQKLEFTQDQAPVAATAAPTSEQVYNDLVALSEKTARSRQSIMQKSSSGLIAAIAALTAAVMLLTVAVTVMAIGWSREQGTVVTDVQVVEVEKEVTVEIPKYTFLDPSVEYERALSDERYLLNDANYGPIFMPILENIEKNEYDPELFIKDEETGYMTYDGDETVLSGVDVSVYQGDIDWKKVKAAGFDFAMIRCGNRGYVTGLMVEDTKFKQNIKGALDAGLQVGVYYFSQAISMQEALDEADFVIKLLDGYDITFPVAFDWEVVIDPDGDKARTAYIEPDQLTNNFLVFAQRLELEGYTPVIYANKKTAVWKYDLDRVKNYDIWYADYNETPSLPYKFEMWQYSSKGSVSGINGNVDLNISFKDYGKK